MPWLLQFEGSLLGDGYHPPGNGENLTRARAALLSDVDLGAHTKIGAELAHRWWDQEGERELTGHIDYSPPGLPQVGLKAEEVTRRGLNSEKQQRLAGTLQGRAGEVGWSLKGVLGRGKAISAAPWREGEVGFTLDYAPLDWLGTELAYSRGSQRMASGPERKFDELTLGTKLQGFGLDGYFSHTWQWHSGAHGLSGAKAPGRELAARTLDLGLSGEFLPGLSWQTEAFLAKERRGDARGERGIGAKLRWTSPRREAAGTLEWFRQLGGTRLVAKEMEELLTLQPSLQLTKSRAQRVWRLSGEYRPGEGERTVISGAAGTEIRRRGCRGPEPFHRRQPCPSLE